jgi:hypothetical protein
VTFDIDANGIVNVQAKDLGTGKEQKITITSSSGLSKEEVERMMGEADSHADEDKKRREEIETRNRADQAVYGAERMIKDTGDKLSSSDKSAIESAMEAVKKAIEGTDAAEIQRALDLLTSAQHKASSRSIGSRRLAARARAPRVEATGREPAAARLAARRPARGGQAATSSTRKWWTRENSSHEIARWQDCRMAESKSCNLILPSCDSAILKFDGLLHRPRLERAASVSEIKRAYKRLARRFHPDINPGTAWPRRSFARSPKRTRR